MMEVREGEGRKVATKTALQAGGGRRQTCKQASHGSQPKFFAKILPSLSPSLPPFLSSLPFLSSAKMEREGGESK